MTTFFIGLVIVVFTTVLTVGSILIVRVKLKDKFTVFSNEAAGATMQVVGTLYAVLLGLLTVHAMGEFDKAKLTLEAETGILDNLSTVVDVFPEKDQRKIQLIIYKYVNDVLEEEWPLMVEHKVKDEAWDVSEELWDAIKQLKPESEVQIATFGQIMSSFAQLNQNKRKRLLMGSTSVSSVLWLVLILGGIAILSYHIFYGLPNLKAEAFMIGLMSITLSLNLYLWYIYSDPFSGIKYVSPSAFHMLKKDLEYYFKNQGVDFVPKEIK